MSTANTTPDAQTIMRSAIFFLTVTDFFAIVDTSQQDCFIVSSYQEKVNDLQSVKLLLQIEKNVIVYVQGGDCYG